MNEDDAVRALRTGQRVRAVYACCPGTHAAGRVIAYSDAPQVLIETDSGDRVWWRVDLTHESVEEGSEG